MANARSYLLLFVLLVNYRLALSQPTFGSAIFCSLFCDDSDESDDDDDYDFYDFFGLCSSCSTKDTAEDETTTTAKPNSQPVKIMIPPSSGMNLTIFSNLGNGILMDLVPWLASAGTSAPATGAPAAAGNTTGNSSDTTTAKPK